MSVFLSVVFAFEHGIPESNKDSKFECRSVYDFRYNRNPMSSSKASLFLVISNFVA